jgi:hypothetical protein
MGSLSERFSALHTDLRGQLSASGQERLDALMQVRPRSGRTRGFADLGSQAVGELARAAELPGATLIARALVAGLAVDVETRWRGLNLTAFVREKSRQWQELLLDYLEKGAAPGYHYPMGDFIKDYRFVHAMSVYFGTQFVDLAEGIGPKTAVKLAREAPLLALRNYLSNSLRFHVENRWLDGFNEEEWARFYAHVAGLLEANPKLAGMISTSWFFDPALARVSPRLGYLVGLPLSGGARIVRHYTTQFDIDSATSKSATRRSLYEAGEYMPVSYSFIWDRKDLIAWARDRFADEFRQASA